MLVVFEAFSWIAFAAHVLTRAQIRQVVYQPSQTASRRRPWAGG